MSERDGGITVLYKGGRLASWHRLSAAEKEQRLKDARRGRPSRRNRRNRGGAPRAVPKPKHDPKDLPGEVKGGGWFTGEEESREEL